MRLEELTRGQVVGVLHIPGRMLRRDIERLEAVVVIGDFAVILNIEAHREEDILNLALNKSDRMIGAEVNANGHCLIIALGGVYEGLYLFLFNLGEL